VQVPGRHHAWYEITFRTGGLGKRKNKGIKGNYFCVRAMCKWTMGLTLPMGFTRKDGRIEYGLLIEKTLTAGGGFKNEGKNGLPVSVRNNGG